MTLLARIFARRRDCLFVDRVSGREVNLYEWRGVEYMADGRFGMWMLR